MPTVLWIVRILVVIALLGVAAAIATPPGRLPLALRGLQRMLHKDDLIARTAVPSPSSTPHPDVTPAKGEPVSRARRLLAFALVVLAALLCLW